jgi:hypothetical protein
LGDFLIYAVTAIDADHRRLLDYFDPDRSGFPQRSLHRSGIAARREPDVYGERDCV